MSKTKLCSILGIDWKNLIFELELLAVWDDIRTFLGTSSPKLIAQDQGTKYVIYNISEKMCKDCGLYTVSPK